MDQLKAILSLLSRREQWQMVLILLFMLPNAALQVAGIASVMPFIAVLAQPDLVETNRWIFMGYEWLGAPPMQTFLAILAGCALVLLVASNTLAALTTWLILRFSYMRVHSLSFALLSIYLNRDYSFFLLRNPSDLHKNVIQEVNQLVTGYLMPLLQLAAQSIVVMAILGMLVVVDPALALTVGTTLAAAYGAVYMLFRRRLNVLGERRLVANTSRFQMVQEVFGAIKDLKVSGREAYYLHAYESASYAFARNQAGYEVITQLPRYALESIAFSIILLIALYLIMTGQSMQEAFTMIALYSMAGYRLMPALQQIYQNIATLRFVGPIIKRIRAEIPTARPVAPQKDNGITDTPPMLLSRELRIRDISFRYPNMQNPVLNAIDLTIPARSTVAFVGESGAGKSTLVDIILGLLHPEEGELLIDDTPIGEHNVANWRRQLGYVPQAIYLADDTLRRNIALGVPEREIDNDAVVAAAKAAAIHEFIAHDLPDGYDTLAGDRGVRLSGGQRQRIGIARALYHNPDVLILDEATSALDGATERAVMDAIDALSGRKTIILIAHRLSTVRNANQIFFLKQGRVASAGTYAELMAGQPEFKRMASAHAG